MCKEIRLPLPTPAWSEPTSKTLKPSLCNICSINFLNSLSALHRPGLPVCIFLFSDHAEIASVKPKDLGNELKEKHEVGLSNSTSYHNCHSSSCQTAKSQCTMMALMQHPLTVCSYHPVVFLNIPPIMQSDWSDYTFRITVYQHWIIWIFKVTRN